MKKIDRGVRIILSYILMIAILTATTGTASARFRSSPSFRSTSFKSTPRVAPRVAPKTIPKTTVKVKPRVIPRKSPVKKNKVTKTNATKSINSNNSNSFFGGFNNFFTYYILFGFLRNDRGDKKEEINKK